MCWRRALQRSGNRVRVNVQLIAAEAARPTEHPDALDYILRGRAALTKDRDALLAFYDFPAEHWKHLRTTNPIESTFATVRHRTIRSKGCLSNKTALAMVFKLVVSTRGGAPAAEGGLAQ